MQLSFKRNACSQPALILFTTHIAISSSVILARNDKLVLKYLTFASNFNTINT